MTKTKKKVKSAPKAPKKLTAEEVLEASERSFKVSLLKKDTELKKSKMERLSLQRRVFELEANLKSKQISEAQVELKLHGDAVMNAEKGHNQYVEQLCKKYGVEELSFDPETLEL